MYSWLDERTWTSAMPSLATNTSDIGALRRTMLPVPLLRFSVSAGRAACGCAAAGAATATVPRPMASAARAVPRRDWRFKRSLVILTNPHRNDGDSIAARHADDWADR